MSRSAIKDPAKSKSSETFLKVLRFIGRYRFLLILSIILAAVSVILQLYVPILFGNAIDQVIAQHQVNFEMMWYYLSRILVMVILSSAATWLMNVINNRMTNYVFQVLEKEGVPTHFVEELSDRETAVKKVEIVPLEVIVRNVAAGSFSKRLGIEEGRKLLAPTLEFSYKDDDLGDPMINDYFAIAIGAATREEIDKITEYTFKVNDVLKKFFDEAGIDLIDFKIEFGRYHGEIILADEISPDTCRLWDKETHEKLDKDRFRRDMGNVEDAYQEVFKRIGIR